MATFKDLFHHHRRKKKIRQKVLASRLGVDPSLISSFECGRRLPPEGSDFLKRLCGALDLTESERAELEAALQAERRTDPSEHFSTESVDQQLVRLRGILRGLNALSPPELEVVQLALDGRLWGDRRGCGQIGCDKSSGSTAQIGLREEASMTS